MKENENMLHALVYWLPNYGPKKEKKSGFCLLVGGSFPFKREVKVQLLPYINRFIDLSIIYFSFI